MVIESTMAAFVLAPTVAFGIAGLVILRKYGFHAAMLALVVGAGLSVLAMLSMGVWLFFL